MATGSDIYSYNWSVILSHYGYDNEPSLAGA